MTSFKSFNLVRLLHFKAAPFVIVFGIWMVLGVNNVRAQAITEGFENITTLPAAGWFTQNNSVPVGSTGWFQGNSAVFPAQAGTATSYIGANFNNTTGTNTISNWLLTPNRTFNNGDVVKFWTRNPTKNPFPDRLEVRFSAAGASTNVGSGPTGIGDFSALLLSVNPTLVEGGYPEIWTEFTITITGLPGPTSGRVGFRYFVTGGGPTGDNSNFIGIDTFSYTPGTVVPTTADAAVDFNGDHKSDYAVVRNTGGGSGGQVTWFINSGAGTQGFAWGISTDFFVPADYDDDGKDDIAIYRAGAAGTAAFYILNSNGFTVRIEPFGQTGDDPTVVDDYNGDGADDVAVYRGGLSAGQQSTWFYRTTAGGPVAFIPWGQNGDFPIPGDMDGNGSADFTVQRAAGGQGSFWTLTSAGAALPVFIFGNATDVILPGDYDGDAKTDIGLARGVAGEYHWYYRPSSTGGAVGPVAWGASTTDIPTQGDYDGDGRTDYAVWRANGTFWVRSVASGTTSGFGLGQAGDYPVANYNSH